MKKYILDDNGEPVLCPDVIAWSRWYVQADRAVALTKFDPPSSAYIHGCRVSTTFLGIDHNFEGSGPPILWETMIFNGPHDGAMWRYSSREAAIVGHELACLVAQGETTLEAIDEMENGL